jgi:hypothetical protein
MHDVELAQDTKTTGVLLVVESGAEVHVPDDQVQIFPAQSPAMQNDVVGHDTAVNTTPGAGTKL